VNSAIVQSDEQLIQEVKAGNTRAFTSLVERYQHRVANTVKGMLGDTPESEDIGQEVFIRFYQSLDRFKGESTLNTYLTRIAINISLNTIKKRKRRQLLGLSQQEGDTLPDFSDRDRSQRQRDLHEWIQTALDKLPAHFKSVIVLRLIEGYSTQETAQILDIPEGTVLSRLSRAQKKMRTTLKMLEK